MKRVIKVILGMAFSGSRVEANAKVVINNRPIRVSAHRMELIREYSSIHNGDVIENIVPRAIVLMELLPAVVAVIGGYADKMLLSAQAKQYVHMSSIFLQAEKKLRKI